MKVMIGTGLLQAIERHGELTYPAEGAGFVLGRLDSTEVLITDVLVLENRREVEAQHNRYELGPQDFMRAGQEAAGRGLDVVGVFHSHPDHPACPSEFDREHALPNFSYLITSVQGGTASVTRAWHLRSDRTAFDEDILEVA